MMSCASEEVYRKALKDVAKCCCLRVIGGGNVALLVLIVASALICQQTWIFSSPYLPWGPDTLRQEWSKVGGPGIIPGRHRGQLCARIPSDQCTSIHHCCTLAGQRKNTSGVVEGKQRIDHGGKAIILARRGHPRTALNALYEVRFGR